MDAGLIFELKRIREEMQDTNNTLKRIAKVLERKEATETLKKEVCEGKNETTI